MLKPWSRLFLILVVAIAISMVIAACTPSATVTVEPDSATEIVEAEEIQLTYWMASNPVLEEAMDSILNSFMEEHPNVVVKREAFPFGEYFQKLTTAFAGGTGPDVFWIAVETAQFGSRGSLIPVADLASDESVDEVIPSAFEDVIYDGKIYAMPLHQLADALYVNKEMAEEAGIRIPTSVDEAWSWDEFVEIAKQLTVGEGDNVTVWGFGVQRHLQEWSTVPLIYQNGGEVLSPDLTRATGYLNSAESVEAMTWFQELFTEHRVISPDEIPDGFPTGQVAIIQAPSTYKAALDQNFPDFEYIVVPFFRGEQCATMTGGWAIGISASTENPEVAWSLGEWVTRNRHAEWVEKSGYLPIRTSVMEDPKYAEQPWNIFTGSMRECGITRPPTPEYTFYRDVVESAIRDIALGGDVQAILDEAAAKLDAELQQ